MEPKPNTYTCACPPGVNGMNCETVIYATFGGDKGLLVVPPVVTHRTSFVISFNIKTTVDTGLILCLSGVGSDGCFVCVRACVRECVHVVIVMIQVGVDVL